MAALKGRQIQEFLKKRPAHVAAVLIYGPDAEVVRDRSDALARAVVADFKDPFNFLELSDPDIKAEPSRLVDEAAALSFAGGERVVRLRTTGDAAAGAAKTLIAWLDAGEVKPNALVLVEGGDLSKGSKLRKAFEGAKNAMALPCYEDSPADMRALIRDVLAKENYNIAEDALAAASAALGANRGVARAELQKLALYMGPAPAGRRGEVSLADVEAAFAEAIGGALDAVSSACADGKAEALADALHRYEAGGGTAIGALRSLQRTFDRLYAAQRFVAGGDPPKVAMKKLRPPVFFGEEAAFSARLKRISLPRLERVLRMLVEAELAAKSTGAPQQEIVERAALRIAKMIG